MNGVSLAATLPQGMVSVESPYTVDETANRFEDLITSKNLKDKGLLFIARVNHTKNAESVKADLRHTQVIMFGNPNIGTPLMKCAQSIAIDLPQKMLFWQDKAGKVWISYNSSEYLQQRHNVSGCVTVFDKIDKVLAGLSSQVVSL